jgi:hypothetical protein
MTNTAGKPPAEGAQPEEPPAEGAQPEQPLRPADQQGLLELLTVMNPYTMDDVTEMDFWVRNPNPAHQADNTFQNMEVEIEKEYPGGWDFKGQSRKVNLALRIKYRYPVRAKDANGNRTGAIRSWITDYLLVGFEDSGP